MNDLLGLGGLLGGAPFGGSLQHRARAISPLQDAFSAQMMQAQLGAAQQMRGLFDPSRQMQSLGSQLALGNQYSQFQGMVRTVPVAKPDPCVVAAEDELKEYLGVTRLYDKNDLWCTA